MTFPFQIQAQNDDEAFMLQALKEAWKAFQADETPVGSVLVHENSIIARGYNQVEMLKDATAHAEMICLTSGSNALNNWRLKNTTLYTTLEPCAMCAGAMILSRIKRIVWAAPDIRQGANGSWVNLLEAEHPIHSIDITRHILEIPASTLMKKFFKKQRDKKGKA